MSTSTGRRMVYLYLFLLVPVAWLAARYDPYQLDGDAVSYMDIANLIHSHQWQGVVNGYWNPLYPACLALGQILFHPTRWNELGAYYTINFFIFLAQAAAMLLFVTALVRLRDRLNPRAHLPLLTLQTLRLLGLGLLVIAAQREFSMGKVRPDGLLLALLLAAFAMMLESLAAEKFSYAVGIFAPLMGLGFGLAYLTKSVAFPLALLSAMALVFFLWWTRRRSSLQSLASGAAVLFVFALVAGPYIAALSHQKHRFDFSDSGALNYAWYTGGTEKMHLEPWMTSSFGPATVHLVHPETQLLASPGVYSYRAEPYGTYPTWFNPSFFNERIVPHLNLPVLAHRDLRNMVLVVRYVFNHPEGWVLLALLIVFGARFSFRGLRTGAFWLPPVLLSLAIWGIYGLVNIEERYVTIAWLLMLMPAFAALAVPALKAEDAEPCRTTWLPRLAAAMVVTLAFLPLAESLRIAAEERRNDEVAGLPHAWYSPQIFGAARGLAQLGVNPGDQIACVGTMACLDDNYWARLAGVRILTEVYEPNNDHLIETLQALPNRAQVYDVLRAQGAKVVVGKFDPGSMNEKIPAAAGWLRLGDTDFYALPLNLPAATGQTQ